MIDKNTFIEDIVTKYPELIQPLMDKGIVCIRCGEPVWGTLDEVASEKGIENIDDIVQEMNQIIKGKG